MLLAYGLALLIGVVLGLLGGGGSILTVPILVYAAGIEPRAAVALALVIVGVTSFVGAALKAREGLLHRKAAILFGSAGMAGALIGAQFTSLLPPSTLMLLFALLMVAVTGWMLIKQDAGDVPASAQCQPGRCAAAGFGVGALTGFLGVGGGFLIVPAMVKFGKIPIKKAAGTSLAIIGLNSLAGFVGQMGRGSFNGKTAMVFSAAALLGMGIGVFLTPKISGRKLSQGFAMLVLGTGLFMLTKAVMR